MVWALVSCILALFAYAVWQRALRKRAEASLWAAKEQIHLRERKIQTILDNAPIVFSAIDARGIFHISEGKGLQKLGRKDNQSVGLSIFEMHNQSPIILDAVKRAMSGEQVATSFELNGIFYDLFMGPEKNASGIVTGVSMLSVDVTERKKAEDEKNRLQVSERAAVETTKLKSEFLANMSHEIRTPINGVLGMTGLLLDTELTCQQREYAEAIKQSASGLLTVINDILDFSKVEAGKLDFEEIDFELSLLVQDVLAGLGFAANHKRVDLTAEVDPASQLWLKGDPGRLRQILNNLVGNAIKFTEEGAVRVRARSEVSPADSGRYAIRVEIEDSGIGIPKDSIERMFVAFAQGEASMSRRFGGTGLGLSISKQLVEKMGGEIGVSSERDKGSTFWFAISLPAGRMPAEDKGPGAVATPLIAGNAARPVILIAEDNSVNQVITLKMLKKMGFEGHLATDGFAAIAALRAQAYDLVLMDCQMPNLDGLEATRRFRADESPLNRGIPILAMTANAMKGDREKCLEAGMDDYVSKPISFEDLQAVVTRWLEIRRRRAA